MHLHEFQTKTILKEYGIPVSDFIVASSMEEVKKAIDKHKLDAGVVKIQVHAGGRGKAGGVKIARNRKELLSFSEQLLGMKMVNEQTGEEGIIAHQILITSLVEIKKEYYLGAIIDRAKGKSMLIASPDGGMEIEKIAESHPERILTVPIELDGSIHAYHLIPLAKLMGWKWDLEDPSMQLVLAVAKAFITTDASLLEINPLVETMEGSFLALDAKLTVDDNALFRQQRLAQFYDSTQISPFEALARNYELAYVTMKGNIGCMVNGAGLAMATMDIIHHYGGHPANFLDVGGGASQEKVAEGFKLILSDQRVKTILVNIFGGIMNCATIAAGIISAANELNVHVPLIVRLEGTNVDEGKKILSLSGLNIQIANSLDEAAKLSVAAAKAR